MSAGSGSDIVLPSRTRGFAIAVTSAQTLWAFFMLVAAVYSLPTNGIHRYIMHYTNWSWTLQFLFYASTAPLPVLIATRNKNWLTRVMLWIVAVGAVPLNGVVWSVAWVVNVLLASGSPFLESAVNKHNAPLVMLGNDVYHVFPVFAIVIYFGLNARIVFFAINELLRRERVGLFLYLAFGGPAISLLLYVALFDPRVVYMTDLSFLLGAAVVFVVLLTFNAAPLALVMYVWGAGRRMLTLDWLERRSVSWFRSDD